MPQSTPAEDRTAKGTTRLTLRGRLFAAAAIALLVGAFAFGNTVLLLASFLLSSLVLIARLLMREKTRKSPAGE